MKRDPLPSNPSKVLTQAVNDASKQAALLSNGSFGTTDLYLSVLWSQGTDNDGTYDEVFVSDGRLAIHYVIP